MMNRPVFSPLWVALALVAFATPTVRAADLIRPKVIVMATVAMANNCRGNPIFRPSVSRNSVLSYFFITDHIFFDPTKISFDSFSSTSSNMENIFEPS
jgi:hypothetical protein